MSLKYTMEIMEMLDNPNVTGKTVQNIFKEFKYCEASYQTIHGHQGATDFVKIVIKGTDGKASGGNAPSLGIIGRLGGIGARPTKIGFVSDGDGAVAAIASAIKTGEYVGER